MRIKNFKRGVVSILLVLGLAFSMILVSPLASPGDLILNPGGEIIEVAQGDNFLIRHTLEWNEPENGAYAVTMAWDCYDNEPSENFTFLGAEAYFDLDNDNLPDLGLDPILAIVTLDSAPSPDYPGSTRYALSVSCPVDNKDPRNGQFNVDITLRASGAGGVPHIVTDNHPILSQMGGIIVIEAAINSWNRDSITIKTLEPLIYPSDDADVYERYPNNNYGSYTSIWVSPYDNRKNRGFLKFSLSEIPSNANILQAKLHLNCWKKEYDDFDIAVHEVENDSWSENTITWNNQPSYGSSLDVVRITGEGWYTWNVTSFVSQEFDGDKIVSFCLKGAVEPHGGRALFDSKEWHDNHPYLELAYTLSGYASSENSGGSEVIEEPAPEGETTPPTGELSNVEYRGKALQYISQTHEIPIEQLRVVNERQANFTLMGRKIWGGKVWDGESSYGVYIDERGGIVDIKTIKDEERKAAHQKYGKLEPALFELLQTKRFDELVSCAIWLKMTNVRPRRLSPDESEYTKYKETLRDAYTSAQRPVADFIRANDFSVTYTSRHAPLIFSKLPKWMIIELQNMPEVDMIHLTPKIEEGLDIAAETIGAHIVWSDGITGSYTRVAVLERGGIDNQNDYLSVDSYFKPDDPLGIHATAVAGIIQSTHDEIRGIAHGAALLSANSGDYEPENIIDATEWAIDKGAHVLNISLWADTDREMSFFDRYFDHVVLYNGLMVVTIAGNLGENDGDVTTPGLGYNVLTVGAIDDKDTETWGDDEMSAYSSYGDPISTWMDREKPEVVAVGGSPEFQMYSTRANGPPWTGLVGDGTSLAAPAVAGAAALLMQEDMALMGFPELVRAVLMASAVHNMEGDKRLSDRDGTGAIVLPVAHETVGLEHRWYQYWFQHVVIEDFPIIHTFSAEEGNRVRVAIAWDSHPDDAHPPATDPLKSDLDLIVFAPDNTEVAPPEWNSFDNPYEIADFRAPMNGTYTAKIDNIRFDDSYEFLGFALCLIPEKATFTLENLYKVSLDANVYSYGGTRLVAKFYDWGDTYQAENVVWSGATFENTSFSEDVPHPLKDAVKRVALVLTDSTENVISTISTFVVRKVNLEARFMDIPFYWSGADAAGKLALESEFMWIPFYWSGAPS